MNSPLDRLTTAENALTAAEEDIQKGNKLLYKIIFGLLVAIAVSLALVVAFSKDSYWIWAIGTLSLIIVVFVALGIRSVKFEKAYNLAAKNLRSAQIDWVKSHGLELPEDAFDKLKFRVGKRDSGTFGVAQLIEGETGKLVSVVLRRDEDLNYALYGTEGRILSKLEA